MQRLRQTFTPLEILYLAVAIATFRHTAYFSAFVFEGPFPTQTAHQIEWWVSGGLIAIAIDVGMLLTSRYMASSKSLFSTFAFMLAFVIAAIGSFVMQVGYISLHIPDFDISPGVPEPWRSAFIQPIVDASVVILPSLLPLLAVAYTIARISVEQASEKVVSGKPTKTQKQHEIVISEGETENKAPRLKSGKSKAKKSSKAPQLQATNYDNMLDFIEVDYSNNTWFWKANPDNVYGPYDDETNLTKSMKMQYTRALRSNKLEIPN